MSTSFEHAQTGELNVHKSQHPVFAEDVVLTDYALSEVSVVQNPNFPQVGFYTDWAEKPKEVVALEEEFSNIRARHAVNGFEFKQRINNPDMDEVSKWDESCRYKAMDPIESIIPPFSVNHFLQWVSVRVHSSVDGYFVKIESGGEEIKDRDTPDIPEHLRPELARIFVLAEIEKIIPIPDSDSVDEIERVAYFDEKYSLMTYEPKDADTTAVLPLAPSCVVLSELKNALKKMEILDRRLGELDSIHAELIADREAALQQKRVDFLFAVMNPEDDISDETLL